MGFHAQGKKNWLLIPICNRFFGVLGILGSEERIVKERMDYNESEKGN
jgi:hypothetical protein